MITYKVNQITGRQSFAEAEKKCHNIDKKFKMGQLKLLMSEIMFLSKVSNGEELVVYVVAAPGVNGPFYHLQ